MMMYDRLLVQIPLLLVLCACSLADKTDSEIDDIQFSIEQLKPNRLLGNSLVNKYTFEEPAVSGNTFYIDPINGSMSGDGSKSKPWLTLEQVIENNLIETYKFDHKSASLILTNVGAPVKGGDRLLLKEGYHGHVMLNYFYFKNWLTIEGAPGEKAILSRFSIDGAHRNLYFKNLNLIRDSFQKNPEFWSHPAMKKHSNAIFHLSSSKYWGEGSNVKLNQLTIATSENASKWTLNDWREKTGSGIILRDINNVEIIACDILNIDFGLILDYDSNRSKVIGNTIRNFTKDGIQISSDSILIEDNLIKNSIKVDDNHDDGIQFFSRGEDFSPGTGTLTDVVVRGNLIIGKGDNFDFSPFETTYLQGIGGFDGFYNDFIIENNVVLANNYHGITLLGALNCQILNNTVIDQLEEDIVHLNIRVFDHKDGRESRNCTIANNISSSEVSFGGSEVNSFNNYIIGKKNATLIYQLFVNPENFDFHLSNNEVVKLHLHNGGKRIEGSISSVIDKDGNQRDEKPDIGAYELLD